jgi:hypothetical protein
MSQAIQEKQQLRERYTTSSSVRPGWSNTETKHSGDRSFYNQNRSGSFSNRGNQSSRASNSSAWSFDASSYKSEPQQKMRGPTVGVPYPPALSQIPKPLSRNDPSYIGKSEIYMNTIHRKPQNGQHICPKCHGHHRMIRCTTFSRAGLQERWYIALSLGVCLNCLMPCHTSFTCTDGGTCLDCGTRHNSLLCPIIYNNQ